MRKELGRYGPSRKSVRVFVEADEKLVRAQWRENGALKTQSWPNTGANRRYAVQWAKARAEGVVMPGPAKLTVRQLWDSFIENQPHLRPRTKKLYRENWQHWESFVGVHFPAEDATAELVGQFRAALTKQELALATVRKAVDVTKIVYRWGHTYKKISTNEVVDYRFKTGKEERPERRAEYRSDEFRALLKARDPNKATQWRPYVALSLCGFQGPRQRAVLHLRWDDVDLINGKIRWRSEFDKQGKDWKQPIRAGSKVALSFALARRQGDCPWVFPSGSSKAKNQETYSAQSLWAALRAAEKRAGIEHRTGRGAHGLRKMVVGNVNEVTGDAMLALQSVGDSDLRMADPYLLKREDRIVEVFATLDAREQ